MSEVEIDVYEEDGIFEASAFVPDAKDPFITHPWATATTEADAIAKVRAMVQEARTFQKAGR